MSKRIFKFVRGRKVEVETVMQPDRPIDDKFIEELWGAVWAAPPEEEDALGRLLARGERVNWAVHHGPVPGTVTMKKADGAANVVTGKFDAYCSTSTYIAGVIMTGPSVAGGAGDDALGYNGKDILYGGSGNDLYYVQHSSGTDVVTDFVPGTDKIDLTAIGYTWQQVGEAVQQIGPDLTIDLGSGDSVVLTGVKVGDLDMADFILTEEHSFKPCGKVWRSKDEGAWGARFAAMGVSASVGSSVPLACIVSHKLLDRQ